MLANMPPIVADEGSITLKYVTANYVYGEWMVSSDQEGIDLVVPDENENYGYVYRPDDRPTGRFDTSFVRMDASIELHTINVVNDRLASTSGDSDVESQMDAGQQRGEGRTLIEREIPQAGFGRLVPGVDFAIGDVVPISIWSRIIHLPVTALDLVLGAAGQLVWKMRAGGQLISDAEQARSLNSEVTRQVASEQRRAMEEAQRLAEQQAIDRAQQDDIAELAGRANTLAAEGKTNTDRIWSNQRTIANNVNSQKEYMYNTRYIIRAVKNLVNWTTTANGILTTQLNVNSTQLSSLSGNNSGAYNNINHNDLNEWADRNSIPITGPSWS